MSRMLDRCAHCKSSETIKLYQCSSCRVIVYCGSKCQAQDWVNHESLCNEIKSMPDEDAHDKEGNRVSAIGVCRTHAGLVVRGKRIPPGLPTNFGLLQAADWHFCLNEEEKALMDSDFSKHWHKEVLGEVDYKAFYDDLTFHNPQEWAELFRNPDNHEFIKRTMKIILSLARIYVNRGPYETCGEVLDKAQEMVTTLLQSIRHQHSAEDHFIFDRIGYDANVIRTTLNVKMRQYRANVSVFQDICVFEATYFTQTPFTQTPADPRVRHIMMLQQTRKLTQFDTITVEEILSLPNEIIVKCMKRFGDRHLVDVESIKKSTALEVCARCNKKEKALGEFKQCPRCSITVYCGKKCQKDDWKSHKKSCGKKE